MENYRRIFAIIVYPEKGSYLPTYCLASKLQSSGCRVIYFGTVDFENEIRSQGFEFITILEDSFGKDMSDPNPLPEGFRKRFKKHSRAHNVLGVQKFTESLIEEKMLKLLRECGVELILLSGLLPLLAPHFIQNGFSIMMLETEILGDSWKLPPPTSAYVFKNSNIKSILWCRILWVACFINHYRRRMSDYFVRAFLGTLPPKEIRNKIREYRSSRRFSWRFGYYGWRPILPEISFFPEIFDFPHANKGKKYLGHCIKLDRVEESFPWKEIPTTLEIVYVSLGTNAARYVGKTVPFLEKIMKLADSMPHLFFIISMGKGRSLDEFKLQPHNVLAVPHVPQLDVLKRASLMITNGGISTVKECILMKVPMIVVPCQCDQPGNAARVVYHGVGTTANVKRVSVRRLRQLVEHCMQSNEIEESLSRLSALFNYDQEFTETSRWILDFEPGVEGPRSL